MTTPSLSEIMQKAKEMQTKMQQAQQKLTTLLAQGEAGAGMAKVTLNGQHEMKAISLDPSLLQETREVIEDVVIAAHQDAKRKIDELIQKEMATIAQDIGLPNSIEE